MAILEILLAPHPILKTKSKPVADVDDAIRTQLDDMLETMYDAPGIGLAANQVGLTNRVIVMDCAQRQSDEEGPGDGEGDGEAGADEGAEAASEPICMVNPEITWLSDDSVPYEEGCLSIPDQYAEVKRPSEVKVTYLDRDGKKQNLHATGLLATCIQHEVDHLDGVMFTDHLSSLKRNMLMRKFVKWKKDRNK